MSFTPISSSNLQLTLNALDDYARETGIDLTKNPFTNALRGCDSPEAILELLEDKARAFKEYRDGNRKLINWLSPVIQVLHAFSGVLGEATSLVPFQPAKAIFVGVDVLFVAALQVGASYDALVDLFECVGNFLKRLHVYTEIPFNRAMTDIIVKIMAEVLSVLALATKQVKQGRFKKFAKKLLGENEIEAVLQRLDRLTQDEARMTVVQTLEVVHGLVNNMKVVMDDGKTSTGQIRQALVAMHETTNDINKMKRDQLQRDIRSWLSPPDPSTNHNIARKAHHGGTAAWFTQANIYKEWKATGSLLWIHGKPGSGKSILCSTIIQEAESLSDAGLTLMSYFYFDFKDIAKQDVRGLLTSLLAQLCAKSDPCYDILCDLYLRHDAGSRQPDDHALTECLKKMLKNSRQPMYIIVDGLDECPNTSGFPTARESVLELLEELVELRLPNLRICVTSRPENDIRTVLEPLTSLRMSLHNESGQKKDILDYISTVVHSDRRMRRWRTEDKQLVIDVLSAKADGMFRWVFCQLETLRRSFPATIRHTLDELPETLDQTYERSLLGIEKEKREHAHRLFQCLMAAVRPLRAEELAEVLAIRFDSGRLPQYHGDWRLEDAQEAVLSACSSLVAIVNVDGSPVVQFSHFSVKEFLTSDRLAGAPENLCRYHVVSSEAHTTLVQASLSILLHLNERVDKNTIENHPFALYAARHWVDHGRFENVSMNIQDAMKSLFDRDKPHFAIWVWIYDIDHPFGEYMSATYPTQPEAVPLYYATLCGFRNVVEHLLVIHPRDVNTSGGYYSTPLHAALKKSNVDIALLLLNHGADVNALNSSERSPLHGAALDGRRDNVELLLDHHADINLPDVEGNSPLNLASLVGELEVVQVLLRRGAAVNHPDNRGWTSLHSASEKGHLDVVQELLDYGAYVNVQKNDLWTPLHLASNHGNRKVAELLIQDGADIDMKTHGGETALHTASRGGFVEAARLLIEYGADANTRDNEESTPCHTASWNGHLDIVRLLLEHGTDVDVRMGDHRTPLILASESGNVEVAHFLIGHGADIHSRSNQDWTSLHFASRYGHSDSARLLLDHGADVNAQEVGFYTPLHLATNYGHLSVAELLIEHGADVDKWNTNQQTPLARASSNGQLAIARLLVKYTIDVNLQDSNGCTPLHTAAGNGHLDIVELLLESGADVNMRNSNHEMPLDMAFDNRKLEVARLLAKHMGGVDSRDGMDATLLDTMSQNRQPNLAQSPVGGEGDGNPHDSEERISLPIASEQGKFDVVQSLLDHGADVTERTLFNRTALHLASGAGRLEVVRLLTGHGADLNSRDKAGWTPLHMASRFGHLDVARWLLDHGADVNARAQSLWTPLHFASSHGYLRTVKLLLERGASVHVLTDEGRTPSQEAIRGGHRQIARLLSECGAHGEETNTFQS